MPQVAFVTITEKNTKLRLTKQTESGNKKKIK